VPHTNILKEVGLRIFEIPEELLIEEARICREIISILRPLNKMQNNHLLGAKIRPMERRKSAQDYSPS